MVLYTYNIGGKHFSYLSLDLFHSMFLLMFFLSSHDNVENQKVSAMFFSQLKLQLKLINIKIK